MHSASDNDARWFIISNRCFCISLLPVFQLSARLCSWMIYTLPAASALLPTPPLFSPWSQEGQSYFSGLLFLLLQKPCPHHNTSNFLITPANFSSIFFFFTCKSWKLQMSECWKGCLRHKPCKANTTLFVVLSLSCAKGGREARAIIINPRF